MALLIFVFAISGLSFAQGGEEQVKSSWYIGFGIGTGDGMYKFGDDYVDFGDVVENADTKTPLITANVGVGAIINPNVHLGGEISLITRRGENIDGDSLQVTMGNILAVVYFFPMEKGFYVKGGFGFSSFQVEYEESGGIISKYTENGFAIAAGIGYFFWVGKRLNIGMSFDYSYQSYSHENLKNSNFWAVQGNVYWF